MNVSNNRPIGRPPGDNSPSKLDMDLTRINREGLEYTREMVRANTSAAQEEAAQVSANRSDLSRESVELSSESQRLAAEEQIGPRGSQETSEERATRVARLEEAHREGTLNTPERAREAAGRLLGDD